MTLKSKTHKPIYYILIGGIFTAFLYVMYVFFYLQLFGVYGVATLKNITSTSEGVDIDYEFTYEDNKYTGYFTAGRKYQVGEKYFVLFSKTNPNRNLLQTDSPVPVCLEDSVNKYWLKKPSCSINNYENYIFRLEKGEANIDFTDFRLSLVRGSRLNDILNSAFIIDSLANAMYYHLRNDNKDSVVWCAKDILSIDYTNIETQKILGLTLIKLGRHKEGEKHLAIASGLENSLLKNGNGKDCENAWEIVQRSEENYIIRSLGLQIKDVFLAKLKDDCDQFKVMNKKAEITTIYFKQLSK